jgi:hypothetical protein
VLGATGVAYSVALSSRFILGFIFLFAAVPKVVHRSEFAAAVADYRLVPPRANRFIARWLPIVELLVGAGLLIGADVALWGYVSSLLLLCFGAAVAVNLVRGRKIDCGCQGSASTGPISWWLVATDVVLAVLAAGVAHLNPAVLAATPSGGAAPVERSDAVAYLCLALLAVIGWMLGVSHFRLARLVSRFERRIAVGGS